MRDNDQIMKNSILLCKFKTITIIVTIALLVLVYAPEWKDTRNIAQAPVSSYIVQAGSLDQAIAAATDVKAEITHKLGIINAVGAQLTDGQRETLDALPQVRTYRDREAQVAKKPGSPTGGDLADLFDTASYSNNDGTYSWSGPWIETYDNGSATSGSVRIEGSRLRIDNSDGGSLESIHRTLDLSTATSATLSFDYGGLAEGGLDILAIEISNSETSGFQLLEALELVGGTLNGSRSFQLDHTASLTADMSIRFRVVQGLAGSGQFVAIDNVRVVVTEDTSTSSASGNEEFEFGKVVRSDSLHTEGVDGSGVTMAVIDTGLWWGRSALEKNSLGQDRILARYDAIADEVLVPTPNISTNDESGHGSHIASVALHSKQSSGRFIGIAPGADLISIKAFGADGFGTYLDVIRALDWVVSYQHTYGIRVLNLSFSAPPQSYYWDDPINQAVMAAWQAGIVVVTSAGNSGPEPMTIGVPGNVPYVITVGAMTDNYSPEDPSDDMMTYWSSAGPTNEAFVKPEVVAPGGHLSGYMPSDGLLPNQHPDFYDRDSTSTMSGTSQAAAVVSGIVALLLQDEPWLTPDDVKCRLMASTVVGIYGKGPNSGDLRYSPFQQGAGRVDAYDAVHGDHYRLRQRRPRHRPGPGGNRALHGTHPTG